MHGEVGPDEQFAVTSQVLGLLVGLTLRNPENAERAVEEGCVDVVIEVSTQWPQATMSIASPKYDLMTGDCVLQRLWAGSPGPDFA